MIVSFLVRLVGGLFARGLPSHCAGFIRIRIIRVTQRFRKLHWKERTFRLNPRSISRRAGAIASTSRITRSERTLNGNPQDLAGRMCLNGGEQRQGGVRASLRRVGRNRVGRPIAPPPARNWLARSCFLTMARLPRSRDYAELTRDVTIHVRWRT